MILNSETAWIGLTISSTKTKFMIAGTVRGRPSFVDAKVEFDGDVFQVAEQFVSLGTLVACDNDLFRSLKRHVTATNRAFYGLCNQRTKTKFALYKTFILPVAVYGH